MGLCLESEPRASYNRIGRESVLGRRILFFMKKCALTRLDLTGSVEGLARHAIFLWLCRVGCILILHVIKTIRSVYPAIKKHTLRQCSENKSTQLEREMRREKLPSKIQANYVGRFQLKAVQTRGKY